MRAWRVHELGGPADVLRLDDGVAVPTPGPGQVLIDVRACALNFADSLLCEGRYQESPPLPFSPGLEVAGIVVGTGIGNTHEIGTRVAGSPALPHGGLAELALAEAMTVFAVPDSVDDRTAAAMHVTYQTAWFALVRRARLEPGETVLVHAGAGGVGSAVIQLARSMGATVIATAGGPDKVARCSAAGAYRAIDHRSEDFVAIVNELTGCRGADVVIDPVGGDTFTRSTKCIAWEGRIVVVGAAAGTYAAARTNLAMVKNYSILGLNWRGYLSRRPELVATAQTELTDLLTAGRIEPLVTDSVAFDGDVPAAIVAITSGRTTGKTVVVREHDEPGRTLVPRR